MNKKLTLVLFILLGLFLAALISRNRSILLAAIPFLVYLWMGLLTTPSKVQMRVSREISLPRYNINEPFRMDVRIVNDGPAIPCARLVEPSQPKMRLVEGILDQCFSIPAGGQSNASFTFKALRGQYQWETARLVASDPFGLFEKDLELKAEAQVLVWPDPLKLRHFRYRPHPTIRTAGPNLSRLPGSGVDFWGVREYQPGDPMRSIYWRLAARHPKSFFSKAYEREEMADIGLLLDARAAAYQTSGADDLFEHTIQATASLGKYFLSIGNRVSMLILNDRLTRVFPGYGKRKLKQILDQLAGCTLGDRVSLGTLKYLPVKLFPSRSVIVLISPVLQNDLNMITRLYAEGYQLLLVSPNPIQWAGRRCSPSAYDSLSARAAALERAAKLLQIQKKGIQVIDWDVNESLVTTLKAVHFLR